MIYTFLAKQYCIDSLVLYRAVAALVPGSRIRKESFERFLQKDQGLLYFEQPLVMSHNL